MKKLSGRLLRISLRVFALGVTVVFTIWVLRAFDARKLPDLQVWHTYEAENEFRARDYPDGISLGEYRELEDRLFAEIDKHVYAAVSSGNSELFNRYNKQGQAYAGEEGMAWNRSFVIDTPNPVGGILLLHGASDSPYSVKALAETFASHGLYVAVFRMPGHGTIPTGLRDVELEDWRAIARAGMQHVAYKVGPEMPVYFGGYSAGAALAVDYALDAALDDSLPMPDRLFLYSPSIAITPFARFSEWDLVLAAIPYFRKFSWLQVETEYDPYKYNSFPKNGGYLAFQLSQNIVRKMAVLNSTENAPLLPPTIAFQSLVDSTVRTDSLIYNLFDQMPSNGHELVLFDINRSEVIQHFIIDSERDLLDELEKKAPAKYLYTLVTNRDEQSTQIESRTRVAGATGPIIIDLPYAWPDGVYSLSHVAIPFKPTDPRYGAYDEDGLPNASSFNNMAPRGEQAILAIPLGRLMRLRYNPFFGYVESRTLEFCAVCQ